MASLLSNTNHKLYQCRLLLDEARRDEHPSVLTDALKQSALHCLQDAYLFYLHELADLVSVRHPLSSLSDLLDATALITGEMQQLKKLEHDSQSWLSQMLQAVQSLGSPYSSINSAQNPVAQMNPSVIATTQTQPIEQRWLHELTELIESQRENRQES